MNINYEEVPNIITGKDLDYLSDMYEWNSGCYKSMKNAVNEVNDEDIKNVLNKGANMFSNNVDTVLLILGGAQ